MPIASNIWNPVPELTNTCTNMLRTLYTQVHYTIVMVVIHFSIIHPTPTEKIEVGWDQQNIIEQLILLKCFCVMVVRYPRIRCLSSTHVLNVKVPPNHTPITEVMRSKSIKCLCFPFG